jgi:hypothetical protein
MHRRLGCCACASWMQDMVANTAGFLIPHEQRRRIGESSTWAAVGAVGQSAGESPRVAVWHSRGCACTTWPWEAANGSWGLDQCDDLV